MANYDAERIEAFRSALTQMFAQYPADDLQDHWRKLVLRPLNPDVSFDAEKLAFAIRLLSSRAGIPEAEVDSLYTLLFG